MRRTCYELINTHQPNYTCTRKVPMSNLDRGTGSQDVLRDFPHLLQTSSGTELIILQFALQFQILRRHNINHELQNVSAGVTSVDQGYASFFPPPLISFYFPCFHCLPLSLFPFLFRPHFLPSSLANPVLAPSVLKDVLCFIRFINSLKAKKK